MSGGMITIDSSGFADVVMTQNGDMVDYRGGARSRLAIGDENDVLTVSASDLPEWTAPAASGATTSGVEAVTSASISTTSTSFVDVTGLSLTKPTIASGACTSIATFNAYNSTATDTIFILDDDGTEVAIGMTQEDAGSANYANQRCTLIDTSSADGNTLKVQMKVSGGTGVCYYNASYSIPKLVTFGVG